MRGQWAHASCRYVTRKFQNWRIDTKVVPNERYWRDNYRGVWIFQIGRIFRKLLHFISRKTRYIKSNGNWWKVVTFSKIAKLESNVTLLIFTLWENERYPWKDWELDNTIKNLAFNKKKYLVITEGLHCNGKILYKADCLFSNALSKLL